jgi:hypothetical protein
MAGYSPLGRLNENPVTEVSGPPNRYLSRKLPATLQDDASWPDMGTVTWHASAQGRGLGVPAFTMPLSEPGPKVPSPVFSATGQCSDYFGSATTAGREATGRLCACRGGHLRLDRACGRVAWLRQAEFPQVIFAPTRCPPRRSALVPGPIGVCLRYGLLQLWSGVLTAVPDGYPCVRRLWSPSVRLLPLDGPWSPPGQPRA